MQDSSSQKRGNGQGPTTEQLPGKATAHRSPVLVVVLLSLIVSGVTFFAHRAALDAGALTFDDAQYLTKNKLVQHPSWSSAQRFLSEVFKPSTVDGYYQPLAMISLMVDYAFAGRVDNLRPFHLTSLLLHIMNTLLIMLFLYALLGRVWIAAAAALLFGVHPLTVETIAWVGERKTVLAAFFALLCMHAYVRYTRRHSWRFYLVCILLYVLALMSKPITTPLPLVLLLLDFWPLNRLSMRTTLEKLPLLAIGSAFAIITFISQRQTGGVQVPGQYSLLQIPLIVCHDMVFYIRKILWPTDLTSHHPISQPLSLSNPSVLAAVIISCILVAFLVASWCRTRALIAGWLIFQVTLLPTMGIIGFTIALTYDKYAYLPAIGYLLILVLVLEKIAGVPGPARPAWRPASLCAAVMLVAGLLIHGTRQYLQEWQTTERHEFYMLALAPNSPYTNASCGSFFHVKGEYGRAIGYFTRAIELKPDFAAAYDNRGAARDYLGDHNQAFQDYNKAIEISPNFAEAYYNRAVSYGKMGDHDRAMRDYNKAIELKPDYALAYNNRATAYATQGMHEQAIQDCDKAIRLDPDYAEAYYNRGVSFAGKGDRDQAIRDYTKATELKPDYALAYNNRGIAYAGQGAIDRAIHDYTKAIELNGDNPKPYNNRGAAYGASGDFDHAIQDCSKAISLLPSYAEAYHNRGLSYAGKAAYEQAIRDYSKAIELRSQYANAYQNRAVSYYRLKQYDKAAADVSMCVRIGGNPDPRFVRALMEATGPAE